MRTGDLGILPPPPLPCAFATVTRRAAPALFFAHVQWEFEVPLCGATIALPFTLSMAAFAVVGNVFVPFNITTRTLLARAHHAAM